MKMAELMQVLERCKGVKVGYEKVMGEVGLGSVREMEDLVIEAVAEGLLEVQLDQRAEQLEVIRCFSTNLEDGDVERVLGELSAWKQRCSAAIDGIGRRIHTLERMEVEAKAKALQSEGCTNQVQL